MFQQINKQLFNLARQSQPWLLCAWLSLVAAGSSPAQTPTVQLPEGATVSALGRTAVVRDDGSFNITSFPSGRGRFRVRLFAPDGSTAFSGCLSPSTVNRGVTLVPSLNFGPLNFGPQALNVQASGQIFTAPGQSAQLSVAGFPNGLPADFTNDPCTTYRSSNPALVTVSSNGLATVSQMPANPTRLLVTVSNEGVVGTYSFILNPNNDADGDGMPNLYEFRQNFDPNFAGDAAEDADFDGLTNLQEFQANTDPRDGDTDRDGISDGALDPDGSWFVIAGPDPDPLHPEEVPPTCAVSLPQNGATIREGETITVRAEATDNVGIFDLTLTATAGGLNNTVSASVNETTFVVPGGSNQVVFNATASDIAGNTGTAPPVTVNVIPDPRTTVIGRVVNTANQSVNNAAVTIFGQFTATTGADGTFTIGNVPTVRGEVVARASAVLGGQDAANSSLPAAAVAAGTTNVGIIKLAVGPTAPTAFNVADYDGDFVPDLFVGYPDRQSLIYQFSNDGFMPSATLDLPFGAVSSGSAINGFPAQKVFVQLAGEPGNVREYEFTGNNQPPAAFKTGKGVPKQTSSLLAATVDNSQMLATGFSGESAFIASTQDFNGIDVLGFLSVPDSNGNALTVRFGNLGTPQPSPSIQPTLANTANPTPPGATIFSPPNLLLQDLEPLRSLKLSDVTSDGLDDLLAVRSLAGGGANIVVLPRTGTTGFGTPLESPISTRSAGIGLGASDFAVGLDFGLDGVSIGVINGGARLYVLGDDRVYSYQGDNAGNFTPDGDIVLPTNKLPTGIVTGNINNDSLTDVLVTVRDATTGTKSLLVYQRAFDGSFQAPLTRSYTAPLNSGDTRIALDDWNQNGRIDVVVVDGDKVILLLDVGPITQTS